MVSEKERSESDGLFTASEHAITCQQSRQSKKPCHPPLHIPLGTGQSSICITHEVLRTRLEFHCTGRNLNFPNFVPGYPRALQVY